MSTTKRLSQTLLFIAPCLLLLAGLSLLAPSAAKAGDDPDRPPGWSDETHSNNVEPNYEVVFPTNKVNQLTITVTSENWDAMQADMTDLYGEPGRRGPGGMPMRPDGEPTGQPMNPPAAGDGQALGDPDLRPLGQGPGGTGMGGSFTTTNPIWVTSTVEFQGNVWNDVGVRFKGNSSLMSAWNSQSLKLPFKLDFDEFEDDYPAIKNQRFYGFKQLSLGNNFSDDAMMRDALAYDVYDAAGLVAANTGFYQVILDHGEGPIDLGLYTVVEVIDDTVVDQAFGGDSGNLYEGDGRYVSLAASTTEAQIEESFQKENNEEDADWSDIVALYDVLHSEERAADPEAWRDALEEVFDVDTFLKWLAVSAQIGHWDTYGAMTHNFYLYHDPDSNQLTWITWDHNMTFSGTPGGLPGPMPGTAPGVGQQRPDPNAVLALGAAVNMTATAALTTTPTTGRDVPRVGTVPNAGRMGRGGPGRGASLDKADINDNWPLIRYLLDDPVYHARYVDYLEETSAILAPDAMSERIKAYGNLLAPYAEAEIGADDYDATVQRVIDYVNTRAKEVRTFLANQE